MFLHKCAYGIKKFFKKGWTNVFRDFFFNFKAIFGQLTSKWYLEKCPEVRQRRIYRLFLKKYRFGFCEHVIGLTWPITCRRRCHEDNFSFRPLLPRHPDINGQKTWNRSFCRAVKKVHLSATPRNWSEQRVSISSSLSLAVVYSKCWKDRRGVGRKRSLAKQADIGFPPSLPPLFFHWLKVGSPLSPFLFKGKGSNGTKEEERGEGFSQA